MSPPWQQPGQGVEDINSEDSHTGRQGGAKEGGGGGLHYVITATVVPTILPATQPKSPKTPPPCSMLQRMIGPPQADLICRYQTKFKDGF